MILVLCTANLCRSVMAEALLSAHLAARGVSVPVSSAGVASTFPAQPASPEVIAVMAARGQDVTRHRSRTLTREDIADADLIVGMERDHVRHAVVLLPDAWQRTFTLRELVRRGSQAGVRGPGEPLWAWLARISADRDRHGLLGRSPVDDVADPAGGPARGYEATAVLLDQLTHELVTLCWPG